MEVQHSHSLEVGKLQRSLTEEKARREASEESLRLVQQQSGDVSISMEDNTADVAGGALNGNGMCSCLCVFANSFIVFPLI